MFGHLQPHQFFADEIVPIEILSILVTMTVTITRNPNLTAPLRENNLKNSVQQKFGQSWWTGLSPEACCGFDRDYHGKMFWIILIIPGR